MRTRTWTTFCCQLQCINHLQAFLYKCPETLIKVANLHLGEKPDQGNSRRAEEVMIQSFQCDDTDVLTSLLKHLSKVPNTPQTDGSGQNHFPPTCLTKEPVFSLRVLWRNLPFTENHWVAQGCWNSESCVEHQAGHEGTVALVGRKWKPAHFLPPVSPLLSISGFPADYTLSLEPSFPFAWGHLSS